MRLPCGTARWCVWKREGAPGHRDSQRTDRKELRSRGQRRRRKEPSQAKAKACQQQPCKKEKEGTTKETPKVRRPQTDEIARTDASNFGHKGLLEASAYPHTPPKTQHLSATERNPQHKGKVHQNPPYPPQKTRRRALAHQLGPPPRRAIRTFPPFSRLS